jgi:anti-sigma regulatory factor (Ser/Thr protein kinase)
MKETPKIADFILIVAEEKHDFKTADVMHALRESGFSAARPYVSSVISLLVKQEALVREGSGSGSIYALPKYADSLGKVIRKRFQNSDTLEEYEILDKVKAEKPFLSSLKENIQSVYAYAFSEMANNAIEHSESKTIDVEVFQRDERLWFTVRDRGVGVFRNVMRKKGLNSELEAIQDLLKGKTTTAPQAHSGEGIFFTSKAGDLFILESYGYRLRIDNKLDDIFVEEVGKELKGTLVMFSIDIKSKKHLSEIFAAYQVDPDVPAFDQTEIQIKLYNMGTIYVSRSQARRVLSGLNKFKRVILDFDRVPTIGQAFADEIFRVFKLRNSEVEIVSINTNSAVQFMIDRVDI